MKIQESGIYEIRCLVSNKIYIGSSKRLRKRWHEHRRQLRLGTHRSPRLMSAWIKHGEENFRFSIIEQCAAEMLFQREQHHIDVLKPDYNSMPRVRVITPEMHRKMKAANQRRAALRTHCQHGHEYTPENTYYGTSGKGDKRCKKCNALRVSSIYKNETAEQRQLRAEDKARRYSENKTQYQETSLKYRQRTKSEKQAYDKARRAITRAQKRERVAAMNPEEYQALLAQKRESYHRCKQQQAA